MESMNYKLGIIGMGYVGLPLAVEFGKRFDSIGFDINEPRIAELEKGHDATKEVSQTELSEAVNLKFTTRLEDLASCDIYIVSVPTPIDRNNKPDLGPLLKASESVARIISRGNLVIFESTVYPGATEEDCVPVIEKISGLQYNTDFLVGYSPERINPGDPLHKLSSIKKVTSGSTPHAARLVNDLYASIIKAGTFLASSIKVAEAAKVIENTQRDVNIGLINELAIIFNKLGIDTQEVIDAAATKWNFLPFRPGLVGGHCIGVDPYYLTYKAQLAGYDPELILAGRRINNHMPKHIVNRLIREMLSNDITVNGARVLILGVTFKENCPDIRNSKVFDIICELESLGIGVQWYDPWVNDEHLEIRYKESRVDFPPAKRFDALLLTVAHTELVELGSKRIHSFGKDPHVFYDIKSQFSAALSDLRL